MSKNGLLLCAKYAVAPNLFGYCGPDENKNIVDHLKENQQDKELTVLLKDFETLYPYLQLVARENQINNPFDERVVEAYWLGNRLLEKVKSGDYLAFLEEKLNLHKTISSNKLSKIKSKVLLARFLPNHTFHVFNIFKRSDRDISFQTLKTMDECRIGWGKVIQIYKSKIKNIVVKTKSLFTDENNRLNLGEPVLKVIKVDYRGKQFIRDLKTGDWVSFHWGMICDKLTLQQVRSLESYTQKAIDFYNF